ncbi:54S ribosomal protein L2 mitochondrial [Madurella fahalii]|uniref:Large ribosomal subunit protein bL27m n=1 Tax=Madurella fahalii TaxID=1157608 RepID=A0ABQ0G831_9PEZI
MHLVRLQRPAQRAAASSCHPFSTVLRTATTSFEERFAHLRIGSLAADAAVQGRRYASVKSQGAYRLKNKKTIPKKLGAKKTGDQYVLPGNIIYKQRGTIWHPGENTIMGRDHTIHAAVAGYVKYYRDPQRHPDRQYIGVVFNRDDKLPYPPGTPRRRKLNLAAVPRKIEELVVEETAASGIPLSVTRHDKTIEPEAETAVEAEQNNDKTAENSEQQVPLTDGNAVILRLIKEKLKIRAKHEANREAEVARKERELEVRKGTRVLRLQSDYSYRETNWEIGRIVGDVGSLPGTEKTDSRKAKFRLRRRKRMVYFKGIKNRKRAKAARRAEYRKHVHAKREQRLLERAEAMAKARAAKVSKDAAVADKTKVEA